MKHDWEQGVCLRCGATYAYPTPGPCPRSVAVRSSLRDYFRGIRSFYVTSFTTPPQRYVLKVIRRPGARRVTCDCPDFYHRALPLRRACKHVRLLRAVISRFGGVSRIPHGPFEIPRRRQMSRRAT